MKTIAIIDGNGIMFRAFFALPLLTTSKGFPTNAIYGFFTMLNRAIIDFHPDEMIICFDAPGPSFRNGLLKEYQAQRPKIDEAFRVQIPVIKELLTVAGMSHTELVGYEADDLIGTLAHRYKKDHRVIILSADKDMLQLVNNQVTVIAPKKGLSTITIMTPKAVCANFGINRPAQIADLKALTGDGADNYKGAKGVGPKTASSLILQFGSVEQLIKHTEEIKNERVRELIASQKEQIILTKKIATILINVPITIDHAETKILQFPKTMKEKLISLEMKGLAQKLFPEQKVVVKKPEKKKNTEPVEQIGLF